VGGCTQKHPGWNVSGNLVSTITNNILNEFSIGPSHTLTLAQGKNGNISRGANGITLPLLFPVSQDQAIPDMSFGGLNNLSFQGPISGSDAVEAGKYHHQRERQLNLGKADAHF
jgi:hypothetical protein